MRRSSAWILVLLPFAPGIAFALASLTADPGTVEFTSRCVRTRADAEEVTLKNEGQPDATNVRVEVSPSAMASVFPLSGTTTTPTLEPDASLSFKVGFVPQEEGRSDADAIVRYEAAQPASKKTPSPSPEPKETRVGLSGTGIDRFVAVSPAAVNFGTLRVGRAADSIRVTIFDDGDTPLSISRISLDGRHPGDFSIDERGPTTIREGRPLRVRIGFEPRRVGARTADLVIRSNSCDDPTLRIQVAGIGVLPDLAVLPVDIAFGAETVGDRTPRKPITVRNQGGATLRVSEIELDGDAKDEFVMQKLPTLPLRLAPGKSAEFFMRFAPAEEGRREAVLRVESTDPGTKTLERAVVGDGKIKKPPPSPTPAPTVVPTEPPRSRGFSFPIGRYVPEIAVVGSITLFFLALAWMRRSRGIPE